MKNDLIINASVKGVLILKYNEYLWVYKVKTNNNWSSCQLCDARIDACEISKSEFTHNLCYLVNHHKSDDFNIVRNNDEIMSNDWYNHIESPGGYLREAPSLYMRCYSKGLYKMN